MDCLAAGSWLHRKRHSYGALIRSAAKSGQWSLTKKLFHRMRDEGVKPSLTIYNSLLFALRLANQLEDVFRLYEEVRLGLGNEPFASSSPRGPCIPAHLDRPDCPTDCRCVLQMRRNPDVTPDVRSYNSMLYACAVASRSAWGKVHPEVMDDKEASTSVASEREYPGDLTEHSLRAMQVFRELRHKSGLKPDRITYNSYLDALYYAPMTAIPAFLEAAGLGLYGAFDHATTDNITIDFHNFSEGAAVTALRWWLGQVATSHLAERQHVYIVTGWGKTRSTWQTSDIRSRVVELLEHAGIATESSSNAGVVAIDAQALLEWTSRAMTAGAHPSSLYALPNRDGPVSFYLGDHSPAASAAAVRWWLDHGVGHLSTGRTVSIHTGIPSRVMACGFASTVEQAANSGNDGLQLGDQPRSGDGAEDQPPNERHRQAQATAGVIRTLLRQKGVPFSRGQSRDDVVVLDSSELLQWQASRLSQVAAAQEP